MPKGIYERKKAKKRRGKSVFPRKPHSIVSPHIEPEPELEQEVIQEPEPEKWTPEKAFDALLKSYKDTADSLEIARLEARIEGDLEKETRYQLLSNVATRHYREFKILTDTLR